MRGPLPTARAERNGAHGVFRVKITVMSSAALIVSILSVKSAAGPLFSLRSRSNENTTAGALNGVPSWKTTLGRSLNVYVLRSRDAVHDVASTGSTSDESFL